MLNDSKNFRIKKVKIDISGQFQITQPTVTSRLSHRNKLKTKMKYFVLISVALVGTCFAAELRRDEKWPPKMLLDFLAPIRKICLDKTGVTPGKNVMGTAIIFV